VKNIRANQQIRLDIMRNYIDGVISAIEGAQSLEISERHFRRLVKAFKKKGLESLFHGNIGSIPKNKIDDFTRKRIIKLYKTKYLGFNLTHFREKLYELEGLNYVPSYTSLRTILASEKIYAPQPKKRRKIHSRRARYEREGVMIQIDGSHHQWIAGHTPFCLTCAVDDASGRIVGAKFTPTETTFASMDVVEQILERHGRFQMLYSDRAGIYTRHKREGFNNLQTALHRLGIICIQANSAQAKGRIERLFRTLQSRLVNEMKLKGIKSIEQANKFLKGFIKEFNKKFIYRPLNPKVAWEKLPQDYDIDSIMFMGHTRVVSNGEAISFKGKTGSLRISALG
jgi:transposase InsO family protein